MGGKGGHIGSPACALSRSHAPAQPLNADAGAAAADWGGLGSQASPRCAPRHSAHLPLCALPLQASRAWAQAPSCRQPSADNSPHHHPAPAILQATIDASIQGLGTHGGSAVDGPAPLPEGPAAEAPSTLAAVGDARQVHQDGANTDAPGAAAAAPSVPGNEAAAAAAAPVDGSATEQGQLASGRAGGRGGRPAGRRGAAGSGAAGTGGRGGRVAAGAAAGTSAAEEGPDDEPASKRPRSLVSVFPLCSCTAPTRLTWRSCSSSKVCCCSCCMSETQPRRGPCCKILALCHGHHPCTRHSGRLR